MNDLQAMTWKDTPTMLFVWHWFSFLHQQRIPQSHRFSVAKIHPENCWSENETDWLDVVTLIHIVSTDYDYYPANGALPSYGHEDGTIWWLANIWQDHNWQCLYCNMLAKQTNRCQSRICYMNEVDKSIGNFSVYIPNPLLNPIIPPTSPKTSFFFTASFHDSSYQPKDLLYKGAQLASCFVYDTFNTSFPFSQWTLNSFFRLPTIPCNSICFAALTCPGLCFAWVLFFRGQIRKKNMIQINIGLIDTLGTTNMQHHFPISLLSDFSANSSTGYHVMSCFVGLSKTHEITSFTCLFPSTCAGFRNRPTFEFLRNVEATNQNLWSSTRKHHMEHPTPKQPLTCGCKLSEVNRSSYSVKGANGVKGRVSHMSKEIIILWNPLPPPSSSKCEMKIKKTSFSWIWFRNRWWCSETSTSEESEGSKSNYFPSTKTDFLATTQLFSLRECDTLFFNHFSNSFFTAHEVLTRFHFILPFYTCSTSLS